LCSFQNLAAFADAIEQKTALWPLVCGFSVFKLSIIAVISTFMASAALSRAGAIGLGHFYAFFTRSLSHWLFWHIALLSRSIAYWLFW
jgi:hypothetical protein